MVEGKMSIQRYNKNALYDKYKTCIKHIFGTNTKTGGASYVGTK